MSDGESTEQDAMEHETLDIAVVGMACRFPMAGDIREYWTRLCAGEECLTTYSRQELVDAGVNPAIIDHPDYVRVRGEVADADKFDAAFFAIPPREAELMDPQHRVLLECAWEAFEDAGYIPGTAAASNVGVFAGSAMDTYLLLNVLPELHGVFSAGSLQAAIGNDKDSLTSTIAYHLDLRGPAITIQSSSSTSLVAVCVAGQSLLTHQCDMALAGGVSLGSPLRCGYLAEEGGVTSPQGHCRAFDAHSTGFVPGNGSGLVLLKRLPDALADGDHIHAVIKGFAVNNDGRGKVSYTAPSVDAHARAIREAQDLAGLEPTDITYLEAHGTGTRLGDQVELAALNVVFTQTGAATHTCAIGSVKTNIGHLDTAAGIAGLIKTVLAVEHGRIPASLNFDSPNPGLDIEGCPFHVNTALRTWAPTSGVRRAGVSSLGMGGTNAHVIVEQGPSRPASPEPHRRPRVFVCSARGEEALRRNVGRLATFLREGPELSAEDVAYTLCRGRKAFSYRAAVVAETLVEAAERLASHPLSRADGPHAATPRALCLLFPGQGIQYPRMGYELYVREAAFAEAFDASSAAFEGALGVDLREVLFGDDSADAASLSETWLCQPALFTVEYALARLWESWGLRPTVMIGHSLGEWVAATVAGLFTLEDAASLVATRARLMGSADEGGMLAVELGAESVAPLLAFGLSVAALNAPGQTVLSGSNPALRAAVSWLSERDIRWRRLDTSHAFHSQAMAAAAAGLKEAFAGVAMNEPRYPLFSTVLGRELSFEEASDADYWCRQILRPVRFAEAVDEVLRRMDCAFLEVGPGRTLCGLVRANIGARAEHIPTHHSLKGAESSMSEDVVILTALAGLWMEGHEVHWAALYPSSGHRRVPLPGYAFERDRHWIAAPGEKGRGAEVPSSQVVPVEPAARRHRPPLSTAFATPETAIQQRLVEFFEDLLGLQGVGIDDDLFELGGHSLMATILASRIRETFGVELDMERMFAAANVRALSEQVQTVDAGEALVEKLLDEVLGGES